MGRKLGLTCDSLLELTMVDGTGTIRNTNAEKQESGRVSITSNHFCKICFAFAVLTWCVLNLKPCKAAGALCVLNFRDVTTPKFPLPPPLQAHNNSLSSDVFLIFHLLRPNVLPLDDVGLIKGLSVN